MEVTKQDNGGEVVLKLAGCLDTAATPEFAAAIDGTEGASTLLLDMKDLEFISSSALRALVSAKKKRGAAFTIAITGMNEVIREVFDVTGLDEVFEVR